jgi:hypothetical protein
MVTPVAPSTSNINDHLQCRRHLKAEESGATAGSRHLCYGRFLSRPVARDILMTAFRATLRVKYANSDSYSLMHGNSSCKAAPPSPASEHAIRSEVRQVSFS